MSTDPTFGPSVMLGVGGIFAEVLADVAFRLLPMTTADAHDMIDDLVTQDLLGEFRGEPPVDRDALAAVVMAVATCAEADRSIDAIDVNPLLVVDGAPVAVDALVVTR
jgi:acetyl-CoA synthetase (ADP-forming)